MECSEVEFHGVGNEAVCALVGYIIYISRRIDGRKRRRRRRRRLFIIGERPAHRKEAEAHRK